MITLHGALEAHRIIPERINVFKTKMMCGSDRVP
jgi:hypothetical protein